MNISFFSVLLEFHFEVFICVEGLDAEDALHMVIGDKLEVDANLLLSGEAWDLAVSVLGSSKDSSWVWSIVAPTFLFGTGSLIFDFRIRFILLNDHLREERAI